MREFPMMGDLYTVRVPEDVAHEIEILSALQNKSMGEIMAGLIWDGLPTDAKIRVRRERNGAREIAQASPTSKAEG